MPSVESLDAPTRKDFEWARRVADGPRGKGNQIREVDLSRSGGCALRIFEKDDESYLGLR